jgi:DNA-binding HxlR family transcriptional regulator
VEWEKISDLLDLVSRRWTLPVMDELARGARSHNDLARVTNLENQQLDRTLRPLVRRGLVHRMVHAATPPVRVYYSLTPRGRAVLESLSELRETLACHFSTTG